MASGTKKMTLLHLSDFHFRNSEEENTDRGVVLDPLLDRIETDYKKGLRPELVLITGDIAFQGIEAEYNLALPFLKNLLSVLQLGTECLYMVPGNHDVYRKAYRPTENLTYQKNREINAELANPEYRAALLIGMRNYFEFTQIHFPHMKSQHGDLIPFVDRVKLQCGLHLGLVGLNSAWMCRKPKEGEEDNRRIAIGEHQIKSAFEELRDKEEVEITLAMFHHPLSWLAPMDRRVCEQYLNHTIALAGHLHEPGGGFMDGLSAQMAHIQAGGTYLGSDSDWPSRYHYITIHVDDIHLYFGFRAFSASKHQWFVDAEIGDDSGGAAIPVAFLGTEVKPMEPGKQVPGYLEFPSSYAVWLRDNFEYLDAGKLNIKGEPLRLNLPELYVPLYGANPTTSEERLTDTAKFMVATTRYIQRKPKGQPEAPEIETLPAKYNTLLIDGQAGSGKSTLMKRLAYTLSPATDLEPASPELKMYMPILIEFKMLRAYCLHDIQKAERERPAGEEMLDWYLRNRLSGKLDIDTLIRFAESGRLLLLVDGLDEINLQLRNHAVNALGDVLLTNAENKIVLAGRPQGLEGMPSDRFGEYKTSVKELDSDQVELFVYQWFDYFYPGTGGAGKKNTDGLLGDIIDHPAISKLTVNPLMLTAVCLLYMEQKELPDQRAELLKKFVDNMIWRRFDDPETALDHLKKLAHDMHQHRTKEVDKCDAIAFISDSVAPWQDEDPAAFKRRMENLYEEIEPQCGLLVNKEGQTGFWHLIFQEFLTAMYFMDNTVDYHKPISELWNDDWYKEVIELYVSYLSVDHRLIANDIIHRVVDDTDESPFIRWRLAARTLVDFHINRRNPDVTQLVKERLKLIIQNPLDPASLVDAGESLGWLGDDRDLESFVPIAGGTYRFDSDVHPKAIKAFEIARYPVTNQWFRRFVDAGGYENEDLWTDDGKKWLRASQATQPDAWTNRGFSCPNQPVTGVNWCEALAFCSWLEVEDPAHFYFLPSVTQWEAAAAGKEGREFPWGDDPPPGRCNTLGSGIGKPSPVGIFAGGCTPGGQDAAIHDLGGNVWEWTLSINRNFIVPASIKSHDDWLERIRAGIPYLKGGSWLDASNHAHCSLRYYYIEPYDRNSIAGFRCARTLK